MLSQSSEHPFPTTAFCGLLLLLIPVLSGRETILHAQTTDRAVAVVDGRQIMQSEVDRAVAAQLFPLQEQVYALRKSSLENLVLRRILEDEAGKRGLSVEQLRKQLTAVRVEVASSEVEKVYAENASVFGAMSADEAKERIRLDLESQARMQIYREALAKLREASRVEIQLEAPRLPITSASSSSSNAAPAKGATQAVITIIEFSDFQCPFCKNSQSAINQVLQTYRDQIRLVFKHLPLEELHAQAFASARAAVCAGEQGSFWQYHDALFSAESLSPEVLDKLAAALGLNMQRFSACLSSDASRAAVVKDLEEAKLLGINSTPTFIINGRLFRGALSFAEFQEIIKSEMQAARRGSLTR